MIDNPSWRQAWSDGFKVSLRHRSLVLICIISLSCQRALTLWSEYAELDWSIFSQVLLSDVLTQPLDADPTGSLAIEQYWIFLIVVVVFFLGALVLIGVLGLLRDLLLGGAYQISKLGARATRYFWPIVLFKAPIYAAVAVLLSTVIFLITPFRGEPTFVLLLVIGGLIAVFVFAVARAFLSIGPKIIVTEGTGPSRVIYERIIKLLLVRLTEVVKFYAIMLLIMVFGTAIPFIVSYVPVHQGLRTIAALVILGVITVAIKASSFYFYLQLSQALTLKAMGTAVTNVTVGIER